MYRGYRTYLPILRPNAVLLATYTVTRLYPFPGPWPGHQYPQLTSIQTKYPKPTRSPTKILQQTLVYGKISPIGVDPGSIFSSRRRSSHSGAVVSPNRYKPQPNILNRHRGSNNLLQAVSTLLARHRGLCLTFHNRRCGPTNCLQPPPRLDELLSTDTWDFEPSAMTPPNSSEMLTPSGTPTLSPEAFFVIMINWLILVFLCLCDLRTPFNSKITAARCYYRLMLVLRLTLRINPGENCLNTTNFFIYLVLVRWIITCWLSFLTSRTHSHIDHGRRLFLVCQYFLIIFCS